MEQPIAADPPGFANLPKAEQIEYLQGLWDRIVAEPLDLPMPASHRTLAERRLADHRAGLRETRAAYEILDALKNSHG